MRCKINDVKTFKDCVMVSSEILFNFHIICDKEGIRWTGMDKAHVSFIECVFSSDFFESYDYETPVELIVDGNEFQNVIKRCGNSEDIVLVSDEYKLHIKYLNGKNERNFELNYVDEMDNSFNLPNIPFKRTDVEIPKKLLFEYMEDCQLYTTTVNLKLDKDSLIVAADGDLGAYNGKIYLDGKEGESCSSIFSIDKLKVFKKFSTFDELYLSLSQNMPCLFVVKDAMDSVRVKLMVANRISEQ